MRGRSEGISGEGLQRNTNDLEPGFALTRRTPGATARRSAPTVRTRRTSDLRASSTPAPASTSTWEPLIRRTFSDQAPLRSRLVRDQHRAWPRVREAHPGTASRRESQSRRHAFDEVRDFWLSEPPLQCDLSLPEREPRLTQELELRTVEVANLHRALDRTSSELAEALREKTA
jgi:hypothetical protein